MTIEEIAARARQTGRLGIDTEFMGEGRYRSLLCLVQVAVLDDDPAAPSHVEVLDPLDETLDPSPLARVLADPAIEIVMHAGRQDIALLRRTWQTEITNVFDTQIAAGFAGLRAQAGYESLIRDVLKIKLHKSASFTRWDARPLSEEQVSYAREDVLHLIQLAIELQRQLEADGRLAWAREECRLLEAVSDVREVESVFARLPRVNSLDPSQRAVALEFDGLARAGRARRRSSGADGARRRGADRAGKAAAEEQGAPAPDPRRLGGGDAPPRRPDPRRDRARP